MSTRSPRGIGFAPKAALGADATALVADRPSSAEAEWAEWLAESET